MYFLDVKYKLQNYILRKQVASYGHTFRPYYGYQHHVILIEINKYI